MQVLIDGNNVLHAAQSANPERPVSRLKLCQIMGLWSARFARSVLVVFDGDQPVGGIGQQMAGAGVEVRFSGRGITADAVVAEEIQRHSAPRRLLVVSSDRAVARAARAREAKSVRSDDFWNTVSTDLAKPLKKSMEPSAKRRGLTPEETADWMREIGFE